MWMVTSPPPKPASSHCIRDWCSLVYGQPSWDRCTSPTPCKTTSVRGGRKRTPQEESSKVVTQWPTSKAFLGWKNRKLWLLPWMSTGASTEDWWRPQGMWCGCSLQRNMYVRQREWHPYLLMLADSKPPRAMQSITELGHSRQGQTKMGRVKYVSNPCVRRNDKVVYLPDTEYSCPPKEGPLPPVEGASIPSHEETRIDSQGMRACSSKNGEKSQISSINVSNHCFK